MRGADLVGGQGAGMHRAPRSTTAIGVEIPGVGKIEYLEAEQRFKATCAKCQCARRRNAWEGSMEGQGRPLGALMAWLQACADGDDWWEHKAKGGYEYDDRKAARDELLLWDQHLVLFAKEVDAHLGHAIEPAVFQQG